MEEETPTNGSNGDSPATPEQNKPKKSKTHLPGASKAPNQYPKAGSEEEFWRRCEEATTLRARGMTYSKIGARFDVDTVTALRMVRRYLQGAARFYPANQLRELLAHALRDLRKTTMEELASLEGDKDATDKRLACISKAESLLVKEAQLFGLIGVGGDITVIAGTTDDGLPRKQLSVEDGYRVRKMIREARELMDGKAVEAQFTVTDDGKDKGNGDQGKEGSGDPA